MDESIKNKRKEKQSVSLLVFNCNWSISYDLRLKSPIVDPDLKPILY